MRAFDRFPVTELDRRLAAESLFGERVFAVGGRVRDHFANEFHGTSFASKDADYVIVGHSLDEVRRRLAGIARIDEVGASFAALKVTIDGEQVDVALARRETSTGQGHRDFAIDFGPEVTIEEDALRRDFRMNMVSVRCADGTVSDPAGGLKDIAEKRVALYSRQAFADDPLRMERAVQFASRLSFSLEDETFAEIQRNAHLVVTCSAERHQEELNKLVGKSPVPSVGFELLRRTGLLEHLIPEMLEGVGMEQNAFHSRDVWGHGLEALDVAAAANGDLVDRYAAVLHDVGKPRTRGVRTDGLGSSFHGHEDVGADMVRDIFGRLRFGEEMTRTVVGLTRNHMYACVMPDGREVSDASVRRFIAKVREFSAPEPDAPEVRRNIVRQFALRHADRSAGRGVAAIQNVEPNAAFEARVFAELDREPALSPRALAITGRDVIDELVSAGVRPPGYRGDRAVGVVIAALLERVIENPEVNTRERLIAEISDVVKANANDLRRAVVDVETLPVGRRSGEIVEVDRTHVYQDVGRGTLVRYRKEGFETPPERSEVVAIRRDVAGQLHVMRRGVEREIER